MTKSLRGKLILSYLAVTLVTVLIVSFVIRYNSGKSLTNLLIDQQTTTLQEEVTTFFEANGSLTGFYEYYAQQTGGRKGGPGQGSGAGANNRRDSRQLTGLVDENNFALIPSLDYSVGESIPEDKIKNATPIEIDGVVVARIFADTTEVIQLNPEETRFIQQTNLAIGLAAIAGTLVAVLIGILLSGRLLRPIRLLTRASKSLSEGELNQQIPVSSNDELGELTSTFNQMSNELAQADQQRKRLTADITHDLSTPLQILSGYMEMFKDGQVSLTPERAQIMSTELGHLKHLIGDLTTLTQAETGSLQISLDSVQPKELLRYIQNTYSPIAKTQGVVIDTEIQDDVPEIQADEVRMHQVIQNLVENALRYTSTGGRITLSARKSTNQVILCVKDTGSGISAEDLPFVFERFYRSDKSRGGNSGKMGLGLAICKALVEAQGGSIRVESSGPGTGTKFEIAFKSS